MTSRVVLSFLSRITLSAMMLGLLAGAASSKAELNQQYEQAKRDLQVLLKHPSRSRQRDPYVKMIARFEAVEKADQSGELKHRAAYMAALVAEELSKASRTPRDLDDALQRMKGVADRYPSSRLADDALLAAARMVLERRSDKAGARDILADLIARYPKGDMVGQARELYGRLPAKPKPQPEPEPKPKQRAEPVVAAKRPAPTAGAESGDPVDRIGELLAKAELIRTRAGDAAAPAADVLEAEAALVQVESAEEPERPAPAAKAVEPERPALRRATEERPAQIARLTTRKTAYGIELLIHLDAEVSMRAGEAKADPARKLPRRTFYDLSPAKLERAALKVKVPPSEVVKRVRSGQNTLETVRVVVELEGDAAVSELTPCAEGLCLRVARAGSPATQPMVQATLPVPPEPAAKTPPVAAKAPLVATETPPDPVRPSSAPALPAVALAPAAEALPPAAKPDPKMLPKSSSAGGMSLSQQVGLSVKTIVLDPGHGGRDPGAIGPTGLREKDVTLRLAKRIAKRLRDELGVKVVLTRDRDKYLSLEQRTEIANKARADLFISLHVNAAASRRAYGVETFYLNTTDDRYAIRLAARENAGSEKSIGDLQFILADLVTKSNVEDSHRLAQAVQSNVVAKTSKKYSHVKNLGLKHALFYVLIGVRMPSILLESSFISHKREEKRLRSSAYLDTIADGVIAGVRSFVETQKTSGAS